MHHHLCVREDEGEEEGSRGLVGGGGAHVSAHVPACLCVWACVRACVWVCVRKNVYSATLYTAS